MVYENFRWFTVNTSYFYTLTYTHKTQIRNFPQFFPVFPTTKLVFVQSLSRVWLFATSWTAVRQASLSFTISWSLLRLMSIESTELSFFLKVRESQSKENIKWLTHRNDKNLGGMWTTGTWGTHWTWPPWCSLHFRGSGFQGLQRHQPLVQLKTDLEPVVK